MPWGCQGATDDTFGVFWAPGRADLTPTIIRGVKFVSDAWAHFLAQSHAPFSTHMCLADS